MKTVFYMMAGALVVAGAAHAESMTTTEVQTTETSTEMVPTPMPDGNVEMVPTTTYTTTVETMTVGSAPTVDPGSMATVKLENGTTAQFPDTAEKSWQEYAREQGYDRFTFDPESNMFMVGKGDAKFASKWDDMGNKVNAAVSGSSMAKKSEMKMEAKMDSKAEANVEPAAAPMEENATSESSSMESMSSDTMDSTDGTNGQ